MRLLFETLKDRVERRMRFAVREGCANALPEQPEMRRLQSDDGAELGREYDFADWWVGECQDAGGSLSHVTSSADVAIATC